MNPLSTHQRYRRLALTLALMILSFMAGIFWGEINEYERGKQDMLKMIETKLNRTPPPPAI